MIRQLTPLDAEMYKQLRLKALQTDPQVYHSTYELEAPQPFTFFIETLEHANIPPIYGYYGYFVKEQLVGYLQLEYPKDLDVPQAAKLMNLYVDPDFRGKKIGQQLFDHITELAKKNGIEKLFLSCVSTNTPALKLYAEQGFQEYARKPQSFHWQGQYDDEVMLMKKLT